MNSEKSFSLDRLLAWLGGDALEAGRKYVRFHQQLIEYLEKHGAESVAEELTDKAFNRIDEKLASPSLSEHFNSREISDAAGLCRIIYIGGAQNSPCPGRKIWQFLSSDDRNLVTNLSQNEKIEAKERMRFSQALNEIMRRRDFYCEENFNSLLSETNTAENPLIASVNADLKRGLSNFSQPEIEHFNRRLLDAAFPTIIKRNLADTPDEEKLNRCKRFARTVLLEYFKKPSFDVPKPPEPPDDGGRLKCQNECLSKLSPRNRVIFEKYHTGINFKAANNEPLSDKEIKEIRKKLAEEFGLSSATIRTIVARVLKIMKKCIERCMKR